MTRDGSGELVHPPTLTCADPGGGGAGGPDTPPLENHKHIWFLSNTGPDPLKITKLSS